MLSLSTFRCLVILFSIRENEFLYEVCSNKCLTLKWTMNEKLIILDVVPLWIQNIYFREFRSGWSIFETLFLIGGNLCLKMSFVDLLVRKLRIYNFIKLSLVGFIKLLYNTYSHGTFYYVFFTKYFPLNFFSSIIYSKLFLSSLSKRKRYFFSFIIYSMNFFLSFQNGEVFFQGVAVSVLLYRCTTWIPAKHIEKWFDRNYRELAILDKTWKQHLTNQQLYSHLTSHPRNTNKTP